MAVNYLNLDRFPILYNHYVFVDTSDYLADQLFIRHKVRVHFGEEMEHPEFPYIFIFCKVRKKNRQRFLDALQEMSDKMMLLRHLDYDAFCEEWIGRLRKNIGRKRKRRPETDTEATAA